MKILVVDDEKLLVKGIKFNLENEGYQVETAFDGAAAVELARSESFDLIILDLMMPEVDGLTACMRIREFSAVPIIMLTARSEDADKIRAETTMIGMPDHARTDSTTLTPSISGRPRSSSTMLGACDEAAAMAAWAVSTAI